VQSTRAAVTGCGRRGTRARRPNLRSDGSGDGDDEDEGPLGSPLGAHDGLSRPRRQGSPKMKLADSPRTDALQMDVSCAALACLSL
jgi:hypothetical protein